MTKVNPATPEELKFTYNASGDRVIKKVSDAGVERRLFYVREAGGKVVAVYEQICEPQEPPLPLEHRDTDGDGYNDDVDICPCKENPPGQNTILVMPDADDDGIPDLCDRDKFPPNTDGVANTSNDADDDGVDDDHDNCMCIDNPDNPPGTNNQADADSDGIGDECDTPCELVLLELHVYGNGSEGRIAITRPSEVTRNGLKGDTSVITYTTRVLDEKVYELKDHLGNVRVVLGDTKLNTTQEGELPYEVDLKSYSNYYPFGMLQPGRHITAVAGYRYGFNGKESDSEWNNAQGTESGDGNMYDFGARSLDSRIGRWLSVDPKDYNAVDMSPYVNVYNNPIIVIDPDGKEGVVVSGSPGPHRVRTHFLINGLDRAIEQKKFFEDAGLKDGVTWLIYDDPNDKLGFSDSDLKQYRQKAKEQGISVIVVSDADEIENYVNSKRTDRESVSESRAKDRVRYFSYVGHSGSYFMLDYSGSPANDTESTSPDEFEEDAFHPATLIDLTRGCNTAVSDVFTDSLVEDFQEILSSASMIFGTVGQVNFGTAEVDTTEDLIRNNKGPSDTPATIVVERGEND